MAVNKKELARNLKILATTPTEIERQQAIYREKLEEIRAEEKRGIWGKTTLDNRKKEAQQERDRTCNALAKRMSSALEYVSANNAYNESETINISDPRLQDALRVIDYAGKDLSYADQAAILETFKGDVGALRLLEKAYSRNGLYMKDAAHEMQKSIPQRAINEMAEVLSFSHYAESMGRPFEFPIERAMWTRDAFQKQLDRLGLESDADPYSAVLDALADKVRANMDAVDLSDMTEEQKTLEKARQQSNLWQVQITQGKIRDAQARGENPANALNRELAKFDA